MLDYHFGEAFRCRKSEVIACNCAMINETSRKDIFARVADEDMIEDDCAACFAYLRRLHLAGKDIGDGALVPDMAPGGRWEAVASEYDGSLHFRAIEEIRTQAFRRRVQRNAEGMCRVVLREDIGREDMARQCAHLSRDLGEDSRRLEQRAPRTVAEAADILHQEVLSARSGQIRRVRAGMRSLDDRIMLLPSSMTVIAGRNRHGKTALAVTLANHQMDDGMRVGLICVESPDEDVLCRFASQRCGLSFRQIRSGLHGVIADDEAKYRNALQDLRTKGLFLYCGHPTSISDVEEIASMWVQHEQVDVIYVDYVQKLRGGPSDLRERMVETSGRLKDIGLRWRIPVIVLAQLNREAADGIPRIQHLAESSAIEQDSDVIILIDRPDADAPFGSERRYKVDGQAMDTKGKAVLHLAKNRGGEPGFCVVSYDGKTMRFAERATSSEAADERKSQ